MLLADRFGRPLRNLRVSVTDRCNLRCQYCMPEENYVWLPHEDLLHFEELSTLADVFLGLGIDKIRLTGGEPLLRRNLDRLIRMLAAKPGLADLALTTNGILLADQAPALREAGLHRITVSLDTLRPDRFTTLTRSPDLDRVLAGIAAAASHWSSLKIDTVVIRGLNDDELVPIIEYGRQVNAEVRFIEYMDVGGATHWSPERVVSRVEMLDRLTTHFGPVEPVEERSTAPAVRFRLPDGTIFGIIASTTEPFCRDCDRSRLTADGAWYQCLYATSGLDLRARLRAGASAVELRLAISDAWRHRTARGAEDRAALRDRGAFVPIHALRHDPHLEMHTRGG